MDSTLVDRQCPHRRSTVTRCSSAQARGTGDIGCPSSKGSSGCAAATSGPAGGVPVSAVTQAPHAIGGPGHDMRHAGSHLLLAAGAPVGLGRPGAADPADEPFTVIVGLTPRGPADGTLQIKLGALRTSAMWSGHDTIVAAAVTSVRLSPSCSLRGLPPAFRPDKRTTRHDSASDLSDSRKGEGKPTEHARPQGRPSWRTRSQRAFSTASSIQRFVVSITSSPRLEAAYWTF
jgi:hypothetical protein